MTDTQPMTAERLAEIEARHAEADKRASAIPIGDKHLWRDNIAYDAHTDRAELLAEVKRLRWLDAEKLAALRKLHGAARWAYDDANDAGECFSDAAVEYDSCKALREAAEAAWALIQRVTGMTCQDEGCPHYGTPHAHKD